MSKPTVEFDYEDIIAATDAAILFKGIEPEPVWMPRSQIEELDDPSIGSGPGVVVVTEWIAIEKGLI